MNGHNEVKRVMSGVEWRVKPGVRHKAKGSWGKAEETEKSNEERERE